MCKEVSLGADSVQMQWLASFTLEDDAKKMVGYGFVRREKMRATLVKFKTIFDRHYTWKQ